MTPREFVEKWRRVELKERSASQEHFVDVCRLVGHSTPAEFDPTGERFTFEKGASKQRGGEGWADVWYRGHFGWEYKGKHADLEAAYDQLLQYREALENPCLLIVSDMEEIQIHTNFPNMVKRVYKLTLDDILIPEKLEWLRLAFYEPEKLRVSVSAEQVTEEAAIQFAVLADQLRKWGEDSEVIAHFLIRLLFCLFAEDIGLLPKDLFTRLTERTQRNSKAFAAQLQRLFGEMSTGGWFGEHEIAYFDGGLFDDDTALELDSDGMDILVGVSRLDWSSIEPSIFGTLFERSLDPEKRAQLGAHYTSKEDILLIVEPVLMMPLRRRWEEVQEEAYELAEKMDKAEKGQKTRYRKQLEGLLNGFAEEIAQMRVLDPAGGSGNFLYVALRQMLELEKEVGTLATDLGLTRPFPMVSPKQLYGIEINAYAHELAQATVWIGYIQWLNENGYGRPSEPILKPLDNIKKMDAILAYDEEGRPVEPEWPSTEIIIGNPPFLGSYRLRTELGDQYVESIFELYGERIPGAADLVCYWFELAREKLENGYAKRIGLLATNSIRSTINRTVLHRIKDTGNIFMAWSDRPWILDGAAVRVSMVGFDDGREKDYTLNGNSVSQINADLTADVDVTTAIVLAENSDIVFKGMMKGGPFDVDASTAKEMLKAPINPNGRPNSDVVKRRLAGRDVVNRRRDLWIIDFAMMEKAEAALYEIPFEYVLRVVKPVRDKNRRRSRRENWWRFGEPNPTLRSALKPITRCIVTPEVAKHRLFIWMDTSTIPDYKLHVFAREDDYFFGVLHSRIHEKWSIALGAWRGAGNDPSYSSSRTFGTFPCPWPPGMEQELDPKVVKISEAAKELDEKRSSWLNPEGADERELKKRTLTNLYNERPTWLELAHKKLDEALLDAYGWPHDLSDEEILERLLALNLERAGKDV